MFDPPGPWAATHPLKICTASLLFANCPTAIAPTWRNKTQDDDIRFLPAGTPSVRAFHLLEHAFPQDVFACRAVFALERRDGPLSDDDLALVDDIVVSLEGLKREEPGLQIGS